MFGKCSAHHPSWSCPLAQGRLARLTFADVAEVIRRKRYLSTADSSLLSRDVFERSSVKCNNIIGKGIGIEAHLDNSRPTRGREVDPLL